MFVRRTQTEKEISQFSRKFGVQFHRPIKLFYFGGDLNQLRFWIQINFLNGHHHKSIQWMVRVNEVRYSFIISGGSNDLFGGDLDQDPNSGS